MTNTNYYHGTIHNFNKFNSKYIGSSNGTAEGFGFYFAKSKEHAKRYVNGGNLLTVSLILKNKITESSKMNKTVLTTLLKELHTTCGILNDYNDIEYYGYSKVLNEAIELEWENNNDVEIFGGLVNLTGSYDDVVAAFEKVLNVNYIESINESNETIIVALNSDMIRIINTEKHFK